MSASLPDTNVWLACVLSGHPHHEPARSWLNQVGPRDRVYFCRSTQLSLLRLLTTAAVFTPLGDPPLTNEEAWAVHDALMADARISLLGVEPPGLGPHLRTHSDLQSSSPKRWMDAYLAALSSALGSALVTTDEAFNAYTGLDVRLIRSAPR